MKLELFKKILIITLTIIICSSTIFAQNKYWVFFKDKNETSFNPYEYFDAKTIERRLKNGISLYDITDFPVNENYINQVKKLADSVSKTSRWFNSIAIYADNEKIEKIKQLTCVSSVEPMQLHAVLASYNDVSYDTTIKPSQMDLLIKQTERMGGKLFKEKDIDGKGLRIAIFDGGFPTVDVNSAFEHIRKEGRIIKTWNFVNNKEFVYSYNTHGTMVMSCIAGIINGKNIGLATGAEFLLARTEQSGEPFSEEENWLAATEWADKNGADIINSSLGYIYQRYFPEQMDGKTTLVTRAANLAARKGILVINAAGNDGTNGWKIIGAPADADSIISVGGIEPNTDYHISFSSYGPTIDKRLKPNVCSYGHVVAAGKKGLSTVDGTSFASPLVAGFAACAWQTNRNLTNMQMFREIEKSGDLYPYFDYAHGYGVPQADYFINDVQKKEEITFNFVRDEDTLKVIVNEEYLKGDEPLLYYNIQNSKGILDKYYVISVYQQEVVTFRISDYKEGEKLNVHFKGYTETYQF